MSTFLTAQSLTLSYTSSSLFTDLNFTIHHGDKIGLIGHNGCGKSSLLKLLAGQLEASSGRIAKAQSCLMRYVEQYIPHALQSTTVLSALAETLADDERWRAELLLDELGFSPADRHMQVANCSGGQQMRLLLARAIIHQPDLLLLDEPSNHLDLPALLWLEQFLSNWKGAFVLVSHDQTLLDAVTNTTWIMRDRALHHFSLPCSAARLALQEKDETDQLRHASEQKEIDRIEKSAKRLAIWGKVYDNENLARKAKTMFARKERLEETQTELSEGAPWSLTLQGESLPANRLLEITPFSVKPATHASPLFEMTDMRVRSGDRIAVLGSNGCGKSTLLNLLYQTYQTSALPAVTFHDRCRLGYYDQSQQQLRDQDALTDALLSFASISSEQCKRALISAGFEYARHNQPVASLSGGERARLLFVGLTLARYHLLFLDEPTNHLDLDGKEELGETLNRFEGAALLVSHDRSLIEQSCNRFWLIHDGKITEHLTAEAVYAQMTAQTARHLNQSGSEADLLPDQPAETHNRSARSDDEQLLARLISLETLLDDDLRRRPKHQKPSLQRAWRAEIAQITAQLELS
ncbi:ABC-F family ATP-binding cassette domain-containing protein [Photobacterium sp. 1_MG-2023]|uniref:ABC-F family ATP-binding cassette domain-containing protein n=1 Tax=Photobacterium sp. 1_MG-2023 TaxID=3062646 RepID=UPI0026E2CD65|nr:ABC-F family ATP-binding cassette domain-containing protein [Photobacterium sp. 1_MG-2023]MDO6706123.1 ABC-F family ATP-binding cassette domain-containing protein [Photobacterium sp. 1_MG-2023]